MTHACCRIPKCINWGMMVPSFLISKRPYLARISIHVYLAIQHILCYLGCWSHFRKNQNTPRKHRRFNYRLSRPRMTVEDTFGRWKGRFPRFSKRIDMKVEDVIHLVAASCILHNKFELRRDPLLNEWFEQAQDRSYPQPEDGDVPFRMNARERADASDTRNILANFFMTEEGR